MSYHLVFCLFIICCWLVLSCLQSPWNWELVFYAADGVKMLRHSVASNWERVRLVHFFFQPLSGAIKQGDIFNRHHYHDYYRDTCLVGQTKPVTGITTIMRTAAIPVSLVRPILLLGSPAERWDKVLVAYDSPAVTRARQLWIAVCQMGQRLCPLFANYIKIGIINAL